MFIFVFLQRDSDVNRAKPLEGGVDVFGVTFFMPWNKVCGFLFFDGINHFTEICEKTLRQKPGLV